MYRYCVVCWAKFVNIEKVAEHVGLLHKNVAFTKEIEKSYIFEAVDTECGGAQRWEAELVPELARVFGCGSPLSYHGPDVDADGLQGEVKPKPETYHLALVRACYSEERMRDMEDGMDEELCVLANQVD